MIHTQRGRRRTRHHAGLLCGITLVLLAATACVRIPRTDRGGVENKEAIDTALAWCRLDPLPASAEGIEVNVEGSAFTRSFEITFSAPMAEIDAWLARSLGTRSLPPETQSAGVETYVIEPGQGAQYAEVRIERIAGQPNGQVRIRTYWS